MTPTKKKKLLKKNNNNKKVTHIMVKPIRIARLTLKYT